MIINSLKSNKSLGEDEINSELLKLAGPRLAIQIQKLIKNSIHHLKAATYTLNLTTQVDVLGILVLYNSTIKIVCPKIVNFPENLSQTLTVHYGANDNLICKDGDVLKRHGDVETLTSYDISRIHDNMYQARSHILPYLPKSISDVHDAVASISVRAGGEKFKNSVYLYKDQSSEISKFLKYVFGLPFLHPDEVENAFVFDLMSCRVSNNSDILKFAIYLMDNYVMNYALFPPRVRAELSNSMLRTTNSCEAFHSKFNSMFYSSHPNIFQFTEMIKNLQCDVYIKIKSSVQLSKTTREKHLFLSQNLNAYKNRQISRFEFIKTLLPYIYQTCIKLEGHNLCPLKKTEGHNSCNPKKTEGHNSCNLKNT
ncbi:hypothetical protein AGLY_008495 [Aphis glycines]|uniref:Uncharacterized protein n=1 Tax=Aphis glycines TaxID=307491 RepID=A0A6G0TK70_APHGL|nr:hypothetical protein AGLY_008495 [Aphis glycines]